MPALTDTGAYPAFATKSALLVELRRLFEPTGVNWLAFAARVNNTDLTSLTDGASVLTPGSNFTST